MLMAFDSALAATMILIAFVFFCLFIGSKNKDKDRSYEFRISIVKNRSINLGLAAVFSTVALRIIYEYYTSIVLVINNKNYYFKPELIFCIALAIGVALIFIGSLAVGVRAAKRRRPSKMNVTR